MSFSIKKDRCGLIAATTPSGGTSPLVLRSGDPGGSEELYAPQDAEGSIGGLDRYGEDRSPTNTYGLKKGGLTVAAGALKLNHVTVVNEADASAEVEDNHSYALSGLTIDTGVASTVAISASATEIESGTTADTNQRLYWIPAFSVKTEQVAQDIFGAFTITGTRCELTKCTAAIAATVNVDKLEGVKLSSDVNSGLITVSGTILSLGGVTPTITPKADDVSLGNGQKAKWVLTKVPTNKGTEPEAAAKEFTFELQLALKKAPVEDESAQS